MPSALLFRTGTAIVLAAALCRAATDYSLIDAIKRRDSKAADALIAKRANIDAALPDGATALAWAVFLDLAGHCAEADRRRRECKHGGRLRRDAPDLSFGQRQCRPCRALA